MRTQFTVIGIPDDPNYISNNKTIVDIINSNTYFSGGKRHHEIVMPFLPPDAVWIEYKSTARQRFRRILNTIRRSLYSLRATFVLRIRFNNT